MHLYPDDRKDRAYPRDLCYSPGQEAVSLSQVIPVLEHMGLSVFGERPYQVDAAGEVWIHDFATRRSAGAGEVTAATRQALHRHLRRGLGWRSTTDSTVWCCAPGWRGRKQAMLFRASRYLHQIKAYAGLCRRGAPAATRRWSGYSGLFRLRFRLGKSGW